MVFTLYILPFTVRPSDYVAVGLQILVLRQDRADLLPRGSIEDPSTVTYTPGPRCMSSKYYQFDRGKLSLTVFERQPSAEDHVA
jgi:hypothetical protein